MSEATSGYGFERLRRARSAAASTLWRDELATMLATILEQRLPTYTPLAPEGCHCGTGVVR